MKSEKIIDGFDAVKMMREIRDKVGQDIKDMTFEEERAYLDKLLSKSHRKKLKKARTD